MNFASISSEAALSQHNSHYLSSPRSQQPWHRDHQDVLRPNFGDTRSDAPQRSMMLPNQDSHLVPHPWVQRFPDQNLDLSSSRPLFTGNQPPDLGVPGATRYPSEGPLAHANFVPDAAVVHRPTHVTPSPWIAHHTMPAAGPSRFGGDQPVMHTAPPGHWQMVAAPPALPPTSLLLSFNEDPRALHPFPTAQADPAQAQNMYNADMGGWHRVAGADNTSAYIRSALTPTRRLPPPHRLRHVPLVRVEDQVAWMREDVLKVTLWFNWSPNADAEAHEPWD